MPHVDRGAFLVPDGLTNDDAAFVSDAVPTGWMGADLGGVKPGDVVAVWGAGGVGQMAARASLLLGAERVIVIDRFPERLEQARSVIGAETLDYSQIDVMPELREMTGGRGPDVAIEAVGMEAHSNRIDYAYDKVKTSLRLETDRPTAVREAIMAVRKGGSVFVLGVFGGLVDKFPLGAIVNKGLTVRSAQQHGHRYIPMLLERMAAGEITTSHLATHVMPLEDAPAGYAMVQGQKRRLRSRRIPPLIGVCLRLRSRTGHLFTFCIRAFYLPKNAAWRPRSTIDFDRLPSLGTSPHPRRSAGVTHPRRWTPLQRRRRRKASTTRRSPAKDQRRFEFALQPLLPSPTRFPRKERRIRHPRVAQRCPRFALSARWPEPREPELRRPHCGQTCR